MTEFRVTFGSQFGSPEYGADPHPVLGHTYAHSDGWLTVLAVSMEHALDLTRQLLGEKWSNIYDVRDLPDDRWADLFPRGELLRLIHPSMQTYPVALLHADVPPHTPPTCERCGGGHGGVEQLDGRLLVTVYGDGTGQVAWRDHPGASWGPPSAATPAHRGAGA